MYRKLTVLVLSIALVLSAINAGVQAKETDETSDALNALLIGMNYPPEESDPSNWSDETVCNTIFSKLLWDDYLNSEESYLSKADLKPLPSENRYLHFSLDDIHRLAQEAFGRDFPTNIYSKTMFISNNELVIARATGEITELLVQDYEETAETVTAIGIALRNFSTHREFLGYFEAVFTPSPDTIYGYRLISFKAVDGNQHFDHLSASASSEMKAIGTTHRASNVIDGSLDTCWAEGVQGVGAEQWLKLTAEDKKMQIFAIALSVGERKDGALLPEKGRPIKIALELDDGYRQEAWLQMSDDVVLLQQPVSADCVKLTILDAIEGTTHDVTCISEIRLLGLDANAYFPEREPETEPMQEPTVTEEPTTAQESTQEPTEPSQTQPAEMPQSVDGINIWLWGVIAIVLIGAMICAVVLILLMKKK